jgi:hypothetical protein
MNAAPRSACFTCFVYPKSAGFDVVAAKREGLSRTETAGNEDPQDETVSLPCGLKEFTDNVLIGVRIIHLPNSLRHGDTPCRT